MRRSTNVTRSAALTVHLTRLCSSRSELVLSRTSLRLNRESKPLAFVLAICRTSDCSGQLSCQELRVSYRVLAGPSILYLALAAWCVVVRCDGRRVTHEYRMLADSIERQRSYLLIIPWLHCKCGHYTGYHQLCCQGSELCLHERHDSRPKC